MRRTGIVVNNYDPTYKNRIQVRVMGLHTEKVGKQYVILDDDLPWASPAPNSGGNGGSYGVPSVGQRVYVDGDNYHLVYYGQVEVKGSVKQMMHDNAEQSDRLKVIAFSEDYDNGEKDYVKMFYLPETGLNIECNGHKIVLTKYDGVVITSKDGSKIEMTRDNEINIETEQTINLKCNKINITEGALTEETMDRIVLGSRLQEIFNHHIHFASTPGGVTTTEPVQKILSSDFSDRIMIGKNINPSRVSL